HRDLHPFPTRRSSDLAYERVLGPDHPSTLGSRNNLANAYRAAGRAEKAVALHEQVLAARQRLLGPDHPDTAQSQNNLARAIVTRSEEHTSELQSLAYL